MLKSLIRGLPVLALMSVALAGPLAASPAVTRRAPADGLIAANERAEARLRDLAARDAPVETLRSPADAALLHAAFDLDAIRALAIDDPRNVLATFASITASYRALADFVIGTRPDGPARAIIVQTEMVDASLAIDLISKTSFHTALQFMRALPAEQLTDDRRGGARQMQRGYLTVFGGLMMMQSDPGLTTANRNRLIEGLFEDVEIVVESLTPEQRATIRAELTRYAATAAPGPRARLRDLRRLFDRADCTSLCAIGNGGT